MFLLAPFALPGRRAARAFRLVASSKFMKADFAVLDDSVAQARVVLSLLALLSLYVDPSQGGLFHLGTWLLTALLCHLLYSALTYLALVYQLRTKPVRKISIGLDLIFTTLLAFN